MPDWIDWTSDDPPTIGIRDSVERPLLALNIEDGRLVAYYDPADLDEAARIFVDEVVRIAATA